MTETLQDFETYQGNDLIITVTVKENGVAKIITACTVTWVLYDDQLETVLTKTVEHGITLTDPTHGIFTITLDGDDTKGLLGLYTHEAAVTDVSLNTATVMEGMVEVKYAQAT
jgi:phage terminase large subunit-like protein